MIHAPNSFARELRLAATALGTFRTAVFEGRSHLVVPVVALVEGVLHAVNAAAPELVLAEEFSKTPAGWSGRPVVAGHPVSASGARISANDPQVLEEYSFGRVFKPRVDGKRLLMEAWLDPAAAERVGPRALQVLERIRQNETVEVSVGVFVVADNTPGSWNGQRYAARWKELVPDHLAMLPEGTTGACSVAMGCGAPRAAEAALRTARVYPKDGQFCHKMPDGTEMCHATKEAAEAHLAKLRAAVSPYGKPGTPEYARNYYRAHKKGNGEMRSAHNPHHDALGRFCPPRSGFQHVYGGTIAAHRSGTPPMSLPSPHGDDHGSYSVEAESAGGYKIRFAPANGYAAVLGTAGSGDDAAGMIYDHAHAPRSAEEDGMDPRIAALAAGDDRLAEWLLTLSEEQLQAVEAEASELGLDEPLDLARRGSPYGKAGTPEYARNYYRAHRGGKGGGAGAAAGAAPPADLRGPEPKFKDPAKQAEIEAYRKATRDRLLGGLSRRNETIQRIGGDDFSARSGKTLNQTRDAANKLAVGDEIKWGGSVNGGQGRIEKVGQGELGKIFHTTASPRPVSVEQLVSKGFKVMEAAEAEILERLATLAAATDMTDVDLRGSLCAELRKTVPGFLGVDTVYPEAGKLVYAANPEEKLQLYRRGYAVAADGAISLADDVEEVELISRFEPVEPRAAAACGCDKSTNAAAAAKEEKTMDKKDRLKALIASGKTQFKEADLARLETLEDGEITKLEEAVALCAKVPPAEPKVAAAAEPKELSEADVFAKFPGIKAIVDEHQARTAARKTELITAMGQQDVYTVAELQAMELPALERLHKLAVTAAKAEPVVDQSGRGTPRAASADDSVPQPPSAKTRILEMRKRA